MYDYDEINKRMEEKMKSNSVETVKKEQKYIGSLLFLLHLCLAFGMGWLAVMLQSPVVWFVVAGYGFIFLVSILVHKNGNTGKAILLTIGSVFLGIFLLITSCFAVLSGIH